MEDVAPTLVPSGRLLNIFLLAGRAADGVAVAGAEMPQVFTLEKIVK